MEPYDEMPTVRMTRAELSALEDRSNFLGPDRVPGHRFRCNLNLYGGPPRWVVGAFYVDEEKKAQILAQRQDLKSLGHPRFSPEVWYPDGDFIATRWERVAFTDGPAPEHTLEEMQGLIRRHHETKAKLGL